jgi:hypothetical protein
MAEDRVIRVRLPDGVAARPGDIDALESVFQAIVALGHPERGPVSEAEAALSDEGWTVRSRLMWVAEARRRGDCELATGVSQAKALENLRRLVRADQVISAP